jgi:hypothetical protein
MLSTQPITYSAPTGGAGIVETLSNGERIFIGTYGWHLVNDHGQAMSQELVDEAWRIFCEVWAD